MEPSDIRQRLEHERDVARSNIEAMESEYDAIVASSTGSNADDEHDPEGATVAFERARLTALLSEARAAFQDVKRSLEKLDEGRYGQCERCGADITSERLVALPMTRLCIQCAASPTPRR